MRKEIILGQIDGKKTAINIDDRFKHQYILGKTGTGKNKLIKSQLLQDIEAGNGACMIDLYGDFSNELIKDFGDNKNLIILDPSSPNNKYTFNIIDNIKSDYDLKIFIKMFLESVNIDNNNINKYIEESFYMLYYIKNNERNIFKNINKLIDDNVLIKAGIETLKSLGETERVEYWEEIASNKFIEKNNEIRDYLKTAGINNLISNVFENENPTLNIDEIINGEKALILKLNKSNTGENTTKLLGLLLVQSIVQSSYKGDNLSYDEKNPFFLYLNSPQYFCTKSLMCFLEEARKYKVGLVMINESLSQLDGTICGEKTQKRNILNTLFGNVNTFMFFRLSEVDANQVANYLNLTEKKSLIKLKNGTALSINLMDEGKSDIITI